MPKAKYISGPGWNHNRPEDPMRPWLHQAVNPETNTTVSIRTLSRQGGVYSIYPAVMETRGDGASRTFEFSDMVGALGEEAPIRRPTRITDYDGNSWRYEFQNRGGGSVGRAALLTKVTDPRGHATTLERNGPFGKITRKTAPDGTFETWEYAGDHKKPFVTRHSDARGNATTYTRLPNNLVSCVNYPDGTHETWEYNDFNQPVRHYLRNGLHEKFIYDAQGRLTRRYLPFYETEDDSEGLYIDYTYYPTGHPWVDRLKTVTEYDCIAANTITYEYDRMFVNGVQTDTPAHGRGLVTKIIHPDGTYKTFGYDPYGNKVWGEDEMRHYFVTRTTYAYDSYRRLKSVTDPNGHTTTYDYARLGTGQSELAHTYNKPSIITHPSGRKEAFAYDANFRLIAHRNCN
jgi:YD repeat-containing protein